ncbi:lytic polysaccharide monooxygenase [Actinoplanes flavus]|uniref:Lytic polysaccharide monooxygenase n=1 Tax=Actinoplanes flavus TaxID=2820290 RepID=A0ABS3UJK1_9ACTN|nr:lytic polysaccharide monooxygenase [Actinoplanes flavus]MBO3738957.1 lytic polysaccharide monooxygenase [Actinoplanes flavus]
MFVRRLALAGLLTVVSVPFVPAPALAHGSPITPISRSAACAGNGTKRDTAACKAALKATGGFLGAYDNLRLANVDDDRERVPDGKLCSGGIDAYRGLDLARDDFPSTAVRSGEKLRISYRGTIPHEGSFRLYLTRPGYSPERKLTWADLTELTEIKDPPLTGGSYRMRVTLPRRSGRHILYVVWETSSTPDTYYSCSDLAFPVAAAPSPSATPSAKVTKKADIKSSVEPSVEPSAEATVEAPAEPSATPLVLTADQPTDGRRTLGHWLIGGALLAIFLVVLVAVVRRPRRREIH